MSDYDSHGFNYHSKIVDLHETQYLVQGRVKDELTMYRSIKELLECERDNVNKMLDDQLEKEGSEPK